MIIDRFTESMNTGIKKRCSAVVLLCAFMLSVVVFPHKVVSVDFSAGGLAQIITNLQALDGHDAPVATADFASSFKKVLGSMRSLAGFEAMIVYHDDESGQPQNAAILLIAKVPPFLPVNIVFNFPMPDDGFGVNFPPVHYISPLLIPELPPPITV